MLYIVTAVHNRFNITKRFVSMLKQQTFMDFKLLLVDDGSTDGTAKMVLKAMPEAVILQGNGDLWWGGALHEAYKWLIKNAENQDYVFFSNDDVVLPDRYLEKGMEFIAHQPHSMLSGYGYGEESGELLDSPIVWDHANNCGHQAKKEEIANCCSTRSLFVQMEDVRKIGGFHPVLLPHYLSDYEWTIRAVKKGVKIITNDELVYHLHDSAESMKEKKKRTIKSVLSKKSNANPFVRFNFILLTAPFYQWPAAIYSQVRRLR